jgi:hypothetical protein
MNNIFGGDLENVKSYFQIELNQNPGALTLTTDDGLQVPVVATACEDVDIVEINANIEVFNADLALLVYLQDVAVVPEPDECFIFNGIL